MFRGIYSAATGMEVALRNHEITADNLANATVPGFRQRGVAFETFDRALDGVAVAAGGVGTQIARDFTDFTPGTIQQTGNSLDVALNGDGFFTVQGPNGQLFTRDGVFERGSGGELLTTGGYRVLGTRGPITLPVNAVNVSIGANGSVSADGNPIDRLSLASFTDLKQPIPTGTTLFSAPPEAGQKASTATVVQGARETSNVQTANAMVDLIRELRFFEAAERAARTLSDSVQLVTRPQ